MPKRDNNTMEPLNKAMAARIASLMANDSNRAFAQKIGVSEGTVRRILRGEPTRLNVVQAIAEATGTSLSWLLSGQLTDEVAEQGAGYQSNADTTGHVLINAYPHANNHVPEQSIAFKLAWLNDKSLKPELLVLVGTSGDSMAPTFEQGDSILVNTDDRNLKDGAIYVFNFGDELSAKRIQKRFDGSLALISDNKEYSPQLVSADEALSLDILGRAVWLGKNLD